MEQNEGMKGFHRYVWLITKQNIYPSVIYKNNVGSPFIGRRF